MSCQYCKFELEWDWQAYWMQEDNDNMTELHAVIVKQFDIQT